MTSKPTYPSQTRTLLVFPFDESSGRFDTSKFRTEATEGRLTAEDVGKTVREIELCMKEKIATPVFDSVSSYSLILLILLVCYIGYC